MCCKSARHASPSGQSARLWCHPCTPVVSSVLKRTCVTVCEDRHPCLQVEAKVVVGNLDPYRLRDLVGAERFSPELNQRLDAMRRPGTTMKAAAPSR